MRRLFYLVTKSLSPAAYAPLIIAISGCVTIVCGNDALNSGALPGMVECRVSGRALEGMILGWNSLDLFILARDGSLHQVPRSVASDFRKSADRFIPLSSDALRVELAREFGPNYRVDITPHYVVVQPIDSTRRWAKAFESLYQDAWRYADQHKLPITEPVFPMVAVVYRDRESFENSQEWSAKRLPKQTTVGLYDAFSNRCLTFEQPLRVRANDLDRNPQYTEQIIRHEAFHQFAANTGLQSRFVPTPLWLAEGLAMSFEVTSSSNRSTETTARELDTLRESAVQIAQELRPGWLKHLVTSDALFDLQSREAYLLSWAVVGYLNNRRRSQFTTYLGLIQKKKPFEPYSTVSRLRDFELSFGGSWEVLEREIARLIMQ